ncbi:hypothetical protein AAG747_09605 [Rapidithrix thailandica]|uniref:Uncharacterized protein n=1 Tax=Rapidithrix thailandica TaxID=413964 RepID=A0AAW9S8T5_9BACT
MPNFETRIMSNRTKKYIVLGTFIVGVGGYFIFKLWAANFLPQKYTIGTIVSVYAPAKGGRRADYIFYIHGEEHFGSYAIGSIGDTPHKKNDRYFVRYPEGYPFESIMLFDKPVPTHIKVAPPEGWKKLPE